MRSNLAKFAIQTLFLGGEVMNDLPDLKDPSYCVMEVKNLADGVIGCEVEYDISQHVRTQISRWMNDVETNECKRQLSELGFVEERYCKNVYGNKEYDNCENGFRCSLCGGDVEDYDNYRVLAIWNYCPECGAKVINE